MIISRGTAQRSRRLLDMEYKVSEIAIELDVAEKSIYSVWLLEGLPYRKDDKGHFWLHGESVARWIANVTDSTRYKKRIPMLANQAYCVSCRLTVDFSKVTRQELRRNHYLVYGVGSCGHKIVRMSKTKLKGN